MLSISALIVPIRLTLKNLLISIALAVFSQAGSALEQNPSSPQDPLTIFSAASLADVMTALTGAWQAESGGVHTRLSLGASGVIARQIEAGARADLFISANRKWINYLVEGGHADGDTIIVATNRISLVWPCSQLPQLPDLKAPDALKRLLASRRFAMADPRVSPAGDYTKTALQNLSIWGGTADNATYAGNVRLALLLTERGGLPGFVYATDARKSTLACEVMQLPASSHPSIDYIAVIPRATGGGTKVTALNFQQWLASEPAKIIWQKHGFIPFVPK